MIESTTMWHLLSADDTLEKLRTNAEKGLSQVQADARLEQEGMNVLPQGKEKHWWNFLLRQLKSPLVYILLLGALLSAWLGEWIDVSVIILAVLVNVAVGFWQEYRSSHILEKLSAIIQVKTYVLRDGAPREIDAEFLVPGDIVVLKAGNKVPADCRIVSCRHLEINEALLTGESEPVHKISEPLKDADIPLGDRKNMGYMGAIIVSGEGTGIVVETGANSEIGKIALLTQKTEDDPTPLQVRIGRLGQTIAIFVAVSAFLILIIGLVRHHPFHEMIITAIAVAVAAIPEGLPASISIILAISAQRIATRKGVVRHLLAAETLGSASVICSDKTGTMTLGEMHVKNMIVYGNETRALTNIALSNEAVVEYTEGKPHATGETTDIAKMQAFLDSGVSYDALLREQPRISLLPFDSLIRYIASLHSNKQKYTLYVSGAPETVLALSSDMLENGVKNKLSKDKRAELEKTYLEHANNGYRMLGLAERTYTKQTLGENTDLEEEAARQHIVQKLSFVGFVAIRDPIREDVPQALATAREAGIRSIMLTGDHKLTALAIGKDIGLSSGGPLTALEGHEIDLMSDEEFSEKIAHVQIFARVNPAHKMRIIDALQACGEVVAMTGDGVNDAPALKAADIGIAVNSGTDVAKEASDLILLDDSYSTIVTAIRHGRIAFDNIRKVTVFLLGGSFTELILVMFPLLFKMPLPVTAVMILWTNLVEDTLPNVALAFEPGEEDIMRRPPIKRDISILDAESNIIIFVVGITTDIILLSLFMILQKMAILPLDHIQTLVFLAMGLDAFFCIFALKSLRKPIWRCNIFSNMYLIGATVIGVGLMVAAVYVPVLNKIVGTARLEFWYWGIILILGIIEIAGIEIAKWWFFYRKGVRNEDLGVQTSSL